jgi:Uma2 family endonuclease
MATAVDDSLLRHFRALEARLENEPEGVSGEIASGVYLMSPRPRPRHGGVQVKVSSALHQRFGRGREGEPPDWFFAVEPELRSERALSRLVPDVAGWRRSGAGWPDMGTSPVTLMPDWVAEVLSPGTEATDRGLKTEAYGTMGVGSLWLVDCERQRVETFTNVRGRMVAGPVFGIAEAVVGDPYGPEPVPVAEILA